MSNPVGYPPERHSPSKSHRVKPKQQIIGYAKHKARNNQPLELLPHKAYEALSPSQLHTLIAKHIAPHEGNRLDAEAANQMPQPPIHIVRRHPLRRHPPSGENTERVIHHQQKDNQRSDNRNLVKQRLIHVAKIQLFLHIYRKFFQRPSNPLCPPWSSCIHFLLNPNRSLGVMTD